MSGYKALCKHARESNSPNLRKNTSKHNSPAHLLSTTLEVLNQIPIWGTRCIHNNMPAFGLKLLQDSRNHICNIQNKAYYVAALISRRVRYVNCIEYTSQRNPASSVTSLGCRPMIECPTLDVTELAGSSSRPRSKDVPHNTPAITTWLHHSHHQRHHDTPCSDGYTMLITQNLRD